METVTDPTATVVAGMMRENTGTHMLDSGGAYGRNWQRNQDRDFAAEPEVSVTCGTWGLEVTINTYRFLTQALRYEPQLDERFQSWADTCTCGAGDDSYSHGDDCPQGMSWLALQEVFPEHLAAQGYDVRGGLWGDEPLQNLVTINTYNHENLLDQILQYTLFHVDDESYVALSVHGGADVRGGYTRPRIFSWSHDDFPSLLDDQSASLCCEGCEPPQKEVLPGFPAPMTDYHRWDIRDGYSIETVGDGNNRDWADYGEPFKIAQAGDWVSGKLQYLPDGTVLCPECGSPIQGGF